jgi:serine protease AprX
MAAKDGQVYGGVRMSALWGTGGRRGDGARNNAARTGRWPTVVVGVIAAAFLALTGPVTAFAAPGGSSVPGAAQVQSGIYIPATLFAQAKASPQQAFDVIVQGDGSSDAASVAMTVARFAMQANHKLADAAGKADRAAAQGQDALDAAQQNLSAAQQAAANAQADAAAKAQEASRTGKKSDLAAAAKAAQKAAAALAAVSRAQAAVAAAQGALAQARSAAATADAACSDLANRILRQQITDQFSSIDGVEATLTGDQVVALVTQPDSSGLLSVTPDAPVQSAGAATPLTAAPGEGGFSSAQLWPFASKVAATWGRDGDPKFAHSVPTIAIVDTGVESRADFGSRLLASVNLTTLPNNSPGDGRGHGTFVAGIAAGSAPRYAGANPVANLVSLDVLDDSGMGLTSDIIRACQWILDNKATYDIRVANFSLNSTITAPFYLDPLDRAVEQLWFNGVVVVAAAGNYGSAGGPSGVIFSPGDDPFVITVGAADLNGSNDPRKATIAPWSAWGPTIDGFGKPELSAPGRYMVGPVPASSTLVAERPDAVAAPGYMELSGTSFAAPVVAGAAANILAQHPLFTPDMVKGVLMLTATGLAKGVQGGGVGVIQAKPAMDQNDAPNPNLALDQYVKPGSPSGGNGSPYSFDSASWNSAAQSNASWNSVSWNSASWNSASWNSASWNSASWNSASWNSASWNSASWNSASWNSAAQEDAADGDASGDPSAFAVSSDDLAAILANDPSLSLAGN